jgi:hypothetical protein
MVVATLALAVAVAALVVALTRPSSHTTVVAPPSARVKESACTLDAAKVSDFVAQVHAQGHAGYASEPVRVSGDGTYWLLFGPLTAHDAARVLSPWSGGFSIPVPSRDFLARIDASRVTKVTMKGAPYLRAAMVITDYAAPCSALRALIQY